MLLILFVLFFLPQLATPLGHNRYFSGCKCERNTPIIPGADTLAGGLDITGLATSEERQFLSPIFEYTFKKRLCMRLNGGVNQSSSQASPSGCYRIPDQLYPQPIDITTAESVVDVYSSSYESVQTYSETFKCSIGIGTPYLKGSYNYYSEFSESETLLTTSYINQGYGYYSQLLYFLSMPPTYVLVNMGNINPIFNMSLYSLPPIIKSEQDNNMYNQFLEAYGGYYLDRIEMGGGFHYNQYVNKQYVERNTQTEETTQMGIQFKGAMYTMQTGQSASSGGYVTSKDYSDNSDIKVYCTGGDLTLPEGCASNPWMVSIAKYPGRMALGYSPIYTMIYNNIDLYNTLKAHIEYYTTYGVFPSYP